MYIHVTRLFSVRRMIDHQLISKYMQYMSHVSIVLYRRTFMKEVLRSATYGNHKIL